MKKWLSLVVMSTLLLGAAYLAVATETGRSMLKSTAATRAMLAEVDALLATGQYEPSLLEKRSELAEKLATQGIVVAPAKTDEVVKDAEYLRSIGASDEEIRAHMSRANESVEKIKDAEYYSVNGMFDELERLEQEQALTRESYLDALYERMVAGSQLTETEKTELMASGLLDSQPAWDNGRNPLDNVGGPDGYGYRWVDNLNGDTATYAWEDIVGAPGTVALTAINNADDSATPVALSFTFPFYGVGRTTVYPSSNGAIGMTSVGSLSNTCTLPTTTFPQGGIWPLWDDQHTGRGGTGVAGSVSDSGNIYVNDNGSRIIIQWDSVGRYAFPATFDHAYSYQAILYASGKIKFQYKALYRNPVNAVFPSATIGIQQGSTAPNNNFLTYSCNTVADAGQDTIRNRAVWFYQLFLDNDFACLSVVQPTPLRVSPSQVMNVVGRFRNSGNITQSSPVKYQFNGGAVVTEATAVLALGASEDHDFAGTVTAPAVVGDYSLLLYSDLAVDEDHANDTCRVTVQVRECYDEAAPNNGFTDTGTTCGALNDWSNTCLGSGDGGEDYIYRWTTTTNGAWNIRLTTPETWTHGLVVSTSCPPDSFNCVAFISQSQDTVSLNCVPLAAGTYYIMLDRSSGCDASYTLSVTPCNDIARCCYNGGANCIDNGAYDCLQLAGNWDRTTTCAASPCPNFVNGGETCADAVLLPVPYTVRSSTAGGLDDDPNFTCESNFNGDEYVGTNTAPDKWYKIIGTGNTIRVSLCAAYTSYDTQILVTTSEDCLNFNCIGGNDDALTAGCPIASSRSIETFCSELGVEYYVVVDGWSTGNGNFELIITDDGIPCNSPDGRCCYDNGGNPACVINTQLECLDLAGTWDAGLVCPCPEILQGSDECVDAPTLLVGQEVSGTTVGFTIDNVQTCGTALNSAPGVWYSIIGTGDSLAVTTCAGDAAGYDTKLGVFCGDCNALLCVGGDDDDACALGGLLSRVRWCSELGREYFILVTGFSTNSGPYSVVVTSLGPCLGTPPNCSPEGRCCYLDGGTPMCADLLVGDCAALGGQFDAALTCAGSPCPVGRCCYNSGQNCVENTQLECNELAGDWSSTLTCATACPIPLPNDDCATATELVVVPDGSVTAAVDLTTANFTCEDTCDFDSNGPDIFYYFTLSQCRLMALMADPTDTHISIFADGECCGTALLCNDDWGNFEPDLDLFPWIPVATRPTYVLGSMLADTLPAGTYYIRAGHYGTTTSAYTLTLFDFGSCGDAPCDPVVDLTAYVATVGSLANRIQLRFTAPQDADYKVWFTTNPNNDGNPDDGADPLFTLEATIPNVVAGPVLWDGAVSFDPFRYYVVTANCTP